MPAKSSQKRSSTSSAKVVKLQSRKPSSASRDVQRFDPLTAQFTKSKLNSDPRNASQESHFKGKAKAITFDDAFDDRMWVDIYEPMTEAELAVHKRKVEDVRRWLHESFDGGPSGTLRKYRRILVLTGPAGTAKTATMRVLAREMDFELMEWRTAVADSTFDSSYDADAEAPFSKFEAFLNRASSCQNLFTPPCAATSLPKRHVILLEDLPNILHPGTQTQFHTALQALVTSPITSPPVPLVIVVSDAGLRGEASDERLSKGGWGKGNSDSVFDVRTVLSKDLLGSPYVTQIGFNPIAPTLLTKALQALLKKHFSTTGNAHAAPPKEVLDAVVDSANGDIRSAIMALQFACVVEMNGKVQKKKDGKGRGKVVILEAITRREQSLVLFHLLGKVFYNKRKGDQPSSSASAKDIQKEKLADAQLKDPPRLQPWLVDHERRASRVDVDTLYADSPIDSSLFSLYIHQNYPQFADGVEECEGIADWLSWIDCSGGESWYQANPHRFHLLTLGTLHSLPSPVTRRDQKILKPMFFDALHREKLAWEGVRDARGWVLGDASGTSDRHSGWSYAEVALELGGVLRVYDESGAIPRPPVSHRLFSKMRFGPAGSLGNVLGERDDPDLVEDTDYVAPIARDMRTDTDGGWLPTDDIEEF
ncbi:hypothetical protein H0H81_007964 [Sphagnurus paluster]|uniref:Checkpoint protein RAD24-like helical bundle domain-containing protein n=1 Tax=Sphagnurus paluster TaxID=117069 RepID=A0A9P7FWN5_9AGAR|nr:hypothetical protein H0H81_007964 [Sphagnurus paluster]